jgi:gamma-glutamyltranspeptidase/glutathione hydrolase
VSRRGLGIAGPNDASARAGAQLAESGGNAVDAALAGMFAALVSEPGIASLGGGAFVTLAVPGEPVVTVDGGVAVPGLGAGPEPAGQMEELHLEYGGGVSFGIGHASVAVPGTLAALETAHRRCGRAPWAEVVAPAAELARAGFRIGSAAGHYLGYSGAALFGRDPGARAVLSGPDGRPLGAGDTMRIPELGDFLDRVGREGAAALHRGDVARALAADMAGHGGRLTLADLERYQAVVRPALVSRDGGWEWATNPPPAVGGAVLTAMLLLADAERRAAGPAATPGYPPVHALVALQRAVLSHRIRELDLAPSGDARVAAAAAMVAGVAAAGTAWPLTAPSTVHVSAVDGDGVACAVTASSGYGAGISAPGTGVWLNDCLGERELNRLGPHALAPGERVISNMTPTVGRHDDGRVLAIGSPGSDRITTALLQVILGLQAGDSLDAAIGRPRLHVSCDDAGRPVRLDYERELAGELADGDLERRAHPSRAMFFGGVAAALRDPAGALQAAADPRREGGVRTVPTSA